METISRIYPNSFNLPARLQGLRNLVHNLWWGWNPAASRLFLSLDRHLWETLSHNPVAFLLKVDPAILTAASKDPVFLEAYDRLMKEFDAYIQPKSTWFSEKYPNLTSKQIAYFSFEFGLHESLPVYAGGLGILSGDHLKEASDLGFPMVAVGFIYKQGYFTQHITEDGWQETGHFILNFSELPIISLQNAGGAPLTVSVDLPGRKVYARVWQIQVGRVSLYLLDTNIDKNSPADRQLSDRLYSNDLEVRISQEILLGVGGVRALRRLGYDPTVWHMNEGHSAFLSVERLRERVAAGETFDQAAENIRKGNLFTTHTPVPAGNDQFPFWLVDKYFSSLWPQLGLTQQQFNDLGRQAQPWGEMFVMPVLALKLSRFANGVSELHGRVSRRMWNFLWPELPEDQVPIGHVTNGVHTGSWLARRWRVLFEQYLGPDWMQHIDDPEIWKKLDLIPDEEMWAVRRHLKNKLVIYATERARNFWRDGRLTTSQVVASGSFLEPYSLTIGFARRFATYKRATLLFKDTERLLSIINNTNRPVQILFAGKAHPADEPGKLLIQQVYRAVKDHKAGGRLIFLEDYDMTMAHALVQGVDVWLNNPRRPNEASGTSGMKAALNGALNFSILDGWWPEGYNGANGWVISGGKELADPEQQDELDAASLYDTLENKIIPLYYENRSRDGLPTGWVGWMRESMKTLIPQFSLRRMLVEYMTKYYQPMLED